MTRKLVRAKSVLLALADQWQHGNVFRTSGSFIAKYENRCADCGLQVTVGQNACYGSRLGKIVVHEYCPRTSLFDLIPWLRNWEGGDIISGVWDAHSEHNCYRCRRIVQPDEPLFLIRRPGEMMAYQKHSDYVCEGCVKR